MIKFMQEITMNVGRVTAFTLCVLSFIPQAYSMSQNMDTATIADLTSSNKLTQAALDNWVAQGNSINAPTTKTKNQPTLLHLAVSPSSAPMADPAVVSLLLKNGAQPNSLDSINNTPLHYAAYKGQPEIITLLLDAGAEINAENASGETALFRTLFTEARTNNTEAVELLLKRGASIREKDLQYVISTLLMFPLANRLKQQIIDNALASGNINVKIAGDFPLYYALELNDLQQAKALLDKGADPNIPGTKGTTPLYTAVSNKNYDLAVLLLDKGANVNLPVPKDSPLNLALRQQNKPLVELLLQHGANITERELTTLKTYPLAPLEKLLKQQLIDNALQHPQNINALIADKTPLQYAIELNDVERATALLSQGANPDIIDKDGNTPLYNTIMYKNIALATLLLDKGANVNLPITKINDSHLALALRRNNEPLVKLLLQRGAKITQKELGTTTSYGLTSFEKLLKQQLIDNALQHPQNINTLTAGKTPLHYAIELNDVERATALLDHAADPNLTDSKGNAPLYNAVAQNNKPLIALLIEYNANINIRNKHGETPLTNALYKMDAELIKLLIEEGATVTPENIAWAEKLKFLPVIQILTSANKPIPLTQKIISKYLPQGKPLGPVSSTSFSTKKALLPQQVQNSSPTIFNRKNLIRAAWLTTGAALSYGTYYYATSTAPTNLSCNELQEQLVAALTTKDYGYADQLAQKNLQAVQELDAAARQNIKDLIRQAELDLIEETATKSLNPFQPSVSTQLTYLADLSRIIEQSDAGSY